MKLWYLSFATDDEWLGACLVRATDVGDAAITAHVLGCNPGGQVAGLPVPVEHEPGPEHIGKLLNRAQLEALFGPTDSLEEAANG